MPFLDLSFVFIWWLVLFLIGVIFLPFAIFLFSSFFDRGYLFAKVLGMLFLSYTIFALGTARIVPFTHAVTILFLFVWGVISIILLVKGGFLSKSEVRKIPWKFFVFEEVLFFIALIFWAFIRAHEPSIHGLEKYMDFGFVNSNLRTEFFPAKDLWLTPMSINYYYFGHLVTAVLTKLSGIDPAVTYNLMIATLFAFTFTGAFSIGANLVNQLKTQNAKLKTTTQNAKVVIGGLLAGFLVALAGNMHTIYAFFKAYDGENPVPFWKLAIDFNLTDYWYPNATRFIPLTIHEFPLYSFVVSDLHGHVLSIPIVLTIIALLLHEFLKKQFRMSVAVLVSFLLACSYMTNAWDGGIYLLLTGLLFLYLALKSKNYTLYAIRYTLIILGFILFSLPFSIHFKPTAIVSGIGIICAPQFLTKIGRLGPFLFEADHCQRSPLWQMLILHGFWYFWVVSFFIFLSKAKKLLQTDIFVLILICLSTLLIILPEFMYMKDIYPAHYRANTMFKLGYEAFMLLGISTAYIIVRIVSSIKYYVFQEKKASYAYVLSINIKKKILATCYILLATFFLFLVTIYPYFAINSYYGSLATYRGLDGLAYLRGLYPSDYDGLLWIRENISGQPVILEGVGESYTDYARISANTGLPTVVGWPVHEWLWRGSYDEAGKRIPEVERIYTTTDINVAKEIITKYNISYVFVGMLERQKYPTLQEEKFNQLGKVIYKNGQTRIYQITGQ